MKNISADNDERITIKIFEKKERKSPDNLELFFRSVLWH
jgi:hypothetical protein